MTLVEKIKLQQAEEQAARGIITEEQLEAIRESIAPGEGASEDEPPKILAKPKAPAKPKAEPPAKSDEPGND